MNIPNSNNLKAQGLAWVKKSLKSPKIKGAVNEALQEARKELTPADLATLSNSGLKLNAESLLAGLEKSLAAPGLMTALTQQAAFLTPKNADALPSSSKSLIQQASSALQEFGFPAGLGIGGILGLGGSDMEFRDGPKGPQQERFSGTWDEFTEAIQAHSKTIKDAYNAEGTSSEKVARAMAVPPMVAPPLLPRSEAMKTWSFRFPEQGKLLTAPGTKLTQDLVQVHQKAKQVMGRLVGSLPELPENLELHLYDGTGQPFTSSTTPEWDGKGHVKEQAARLHSAFSTLYPKATEPLKEIGLPVGTLAELKTDGELAFVLARELAHATKIGPNQSALTTESKSLFRKAPANTVKADAAALQMLANSGFDPTEGLNYLERSLGAAENKILGGAELGDKQVAGIAFASPAPDQGPRLAAAQAVVESLRRSMPDAMPGKKSEPYSAELSNISMSSEVQEQQGARLNDLVESYLNEQLEALPEKRVGGSLSEMIKDKLATLDGNFTGLGQAFTNNLPILAQSSLDPQEKVDTALFGLLELTGQSKRIDNKVKAFLKGLSPNQDEEMTLPERELRTFLSAHTQEGSWSAESFLKKFEQLPLPGSSKRKFVQQVLMNPSFQRSVAPLHHESAEWKELYASAGELAVAPARFGSPREDFIKVMKELNRPDSKARPLDGVLQTSFTEKVHSQFQSKGWNYSWVLTKAEKALEVDTEFSRQARVSLQPAQQLNSQRNEQDLPLVFRDDKATERLFLAGQGSKRSEPELQEIKKRLLTTDNPVMPKRPGADLEGILDGLLADPTLSKEQESKIIQALLDLTPPHGDRERNDFNSTSIEIESVLVELPNLKKRMAKRSPEQLTALIREELTTRESLETKAAPKGLSIVADLLEKSHRLPSTSLFGRNEQLRKSAASAMTLPLLDRTLAVFEGVSELETGTARLLTESLMQIQKKGLDFDSFLTRYKSIAREQRFVGEPELREQLSTIMVEGLQGKKVSFIDEQLRDRSLRSVLTLGDRAELLASLVNLDDKNSTEMLAKAVTRVESEHKLNKGKPALRKAFRELVAEKFKLQPPQLSSVFPHVEDDIAEQLNYFNTEVRGLSSLTAVTRQQPPTEQLKMLDYMLGRRAEMPAYLGRLTKEASDKLGLGKAPTKIADDIRNALETAEPMVRSMVTASFVSGPQGLLTDEVGKKALIDRFLEPINGPKKELARDLAETLIDSQGSQAGLAVGYLFSLRQKENGLTEGQVLNRLFDSYGTPGIKLKQYLAFTSEFSKFKKDFEKSQDSALPLSYLEAVKLAHHHYGEKWRDHWKMTKILGSGSVNVAVQILDSHSGEHRVLSLPRKDVKTNSDYDFYRVNQFVDKLLSEPSKVETFGYLRGLVNTIRDSVSLEFDRVSVYRMSHAVEDFYDRQVDDWKVKTVRVYSLEGRAIEMDQAQGKTARKVLNKDPDTYRGAMAAIAKVERDALFGMVRTDQPAPQTLHANPDVHDGQVLIDKDSQTVTILDFGQAVNITNDDREYGADLLTIVGGAYSPQKAAEILERHSGVVLDADKLEEILDSKKPMDVFTKLLGTLSVNGGKVPIPVVHWVLGMNRQIALAEKTGDSLMNTMRALAVVRKTGGDMETFNSLRVARRTPGQTLKGGILGPVGAWIGGWFPWVDSPNES